MFTVVASILRTLRIEALLSTPPHIHFFPSINIEIDSVSALLVNCFEDAAHDTLRTTKTVYVATSGKAMMSRVFGSGSFSS